MLKKVTNKQANPNWLCNWARTYIMFALVVCVLVMFGMAAAGYCIAQESTPMALAWTLGVLVSIGAAFVALDQVGDGKDLTELLKRPLGWSWAQWGLMFSGVAVALAITPFMTADSEDDEKKNRMMRVAGAGVAR